jgi:hypothetical protein
VEGGFVKKTVLFTALCLFTLGRAWANPIQGTTNPNAFTQDFINWCQFGCSSTASPLASTTPQVWVSNDGATGTIGLHNGGIQGFYTYQQGPTMFNYRGNFPSGMGVIYNGYQYQHQQAGIVVTFNSGVSGVGAYIDTTAFGPFSATITLFDQNNNPLGSFTTGNGVSNNNVGTAEFIGGSGVGPIFAAQFDVVDVNGIEDFAIGTVNFNSTIPEPSSLLLFGSSALGVAGLIRRRLRGHALTNLR